MYRLKLGSQLAAKLDEVRELSQREMTQGITAVERVERLVQRRRDGFSDKHSGETTHFYVEEILIRGRALLAENQFPNVD